GGGGGRARGSRHRGPRRGGRPPACSRARAPRRRDDRSAARGRRGEAASSPANDDDGAVIREITAGEDAAILDDGAGESGGRQSGFRREQRVEPLLAVELAFATGFNDAVGVDHESAAPGKL